MLKFFRNVCCVFHTQMSLTTLMLVPGDCPKNTFTVIHLYAKNAVHILPRYIFEHDYIQQANCYAHWVFIVAKDIKIPVIYLAKLFQIHLEH